MSKKYINELIEMSNDALNCELENVPVEDFRNMLRIAMKEQDRDTRHACAEACLADETHTNNSFFHNLCMNVRAV